jgi:tRNA A37 threonylcarbamoyladenosine modification protein TsaB
MQSIVTLVDAMRGDVFHARYDRRNDRWLRSGAIGLANWRELIPHLDPAVPLTGPMLAGIPADQRQHPALPTECWQPTAAMVAQIGAREALAGRTADLWRLEPLYIRKSAAEEKLEQTQEH